jgi:2-keto-3-deoxy-L-rhamnonate aldolase RhmA
MRKIKLKDEERIGSYNRVFGTDEGKMVLDDIMRICGVDTISADLGNQNITYYNEGARAVGIKIKNIINKKEIENVRVK